MALLSRQRSPVNRALPVDRPIFHRAVRWPQAPYRESFPPDSRCEGPRASKDIFRITLLQVGSQFGILPISGAEDDLLQHTLRVPPGIHEVARQPIKQFRMARFRSLGAEILRRQNQTSPEAGFATSDSPPRAQQADLRGRSAMRQTQAIAWCFGREPVQYRGDCSLRHVPSQFSARRNVRVPGET